MSSITSFTMFPSGRMITEFINDDPISVSSLISRTIPALQSCSSKISNFFGGAMVLVMVFA